MAPLSATITTSAPTVALPLNTQPETKNLRHRGNLARFFSTAQGYTVGGLADNAKRLALYQSVTFGTLFLGYASYTYARKIFSYAAPTLIGAGLLSQNNMGVINSAQYFAYAISKFLGGLLSDKISARLLFPAGLFLSSLTALAVAFSTNSSVWAMLWFMNGLGQGCGWPACSKLLKKWFSTKQFGTCWSVLTASSNVSGTLGPFIAAYCLITFSWQTTFLVSGLFTLSIALASLILLRDSPKSLSLNSPNSNEGTNASKDDSSDSAPQKEGDHPYYTMLKTPLLWIVSLCYMFVFATKTTLSDWSQVFLINDLQQTQMQASTFNSAFETGGFVGGILAGVLTDKLHHKFSSTGNPRLYISILFMGMCALSLHCLIFTTSPDSPQIVISLIGMVSGGALFGPISIFGIVASESFPSNISGASHAVVALAANVGAILAGWPISKLAMESGWRHVFFLLEMLMITSMAIILLTKNYHRVNKLKSQ